MQKLPERIVCLVTDVARAGSTTRLLSIVEQSVSGGVNMVEVRGHELAEAELVALARDIVRVVGDRAAVVLNGTPAQADATGVDGVHAREGGTVAGDESKPRLLSGQSVHGLESALAAERAGVDYLILGTIFPTPSHPGGITGGTGLVRAVTSTVQVPVIAIGGITAQNAADVIAAGAAGIAVMGAIIDSLDPRSAARELATAVGIPEHE